MEENMPAACMATGGPGAQSLGEGLLDDGQRKPISKDPIVEEAKELAMFYIQTKTSKKLPSLFSRTAATLRRTVDELLERHHYFFNNMVNRLQVSPETSHNNTFKNVADEMFMDQAPNWGRVVALFAFAGSIATNNPEVAPTIGKLLGEYIGDHLSEWIKENGGWEALIDVFDGDPQLEISVQHTFTMSVLGCVNTSVLPRCLS